jgi:TatD DNase family protein
MAEPAQPAEVEPLFDSHAHLGFDRYADDLDTVLDRARAGGVRGVVAIGSGGGVEALDAARALAARHDWIWATAGLHPHEASLGDEATRRIVERAAASADVVAVGEAGLDYHYDHSPRDEQRAVFAWQCGLAREVRKPLVIHTRAADEDTLAILRAEGVGEAGGVVHCFSGGPVFAEAALALGLSISFSGIATFPNAGEVREAVAVVPDHALLIETDCPYLAPPPHRGRRNEPAFVVEVARTVARVRGVSLADVARMTDRNARRLFGLPTRERAPIAYGIRDQLYVNATNRCTLACVFCPKRRDWTVKGHLLRHDEEPTDEQVRRAVLETVTPAHREVVFCGLGEPTTRFDLVTGLGRELRATGMRTRLDTDGLASLREGRDVALEIAAAFDAVSVSLNAADATTYAALCPSSYGPAAFDAVVAFLRAARRVVGEVTATVVEAPEVDVEAVRRLVEEDIGVRFRARPYNVVG